MQRVTKAYKNSIRQMQRNRGYIKVTIGVINSKAQKSLDFSEDNVLIYYSEPQKILNGEKVTREYATAEQDFTRLDGNCYFAPNEDAIFYNSGVVTDDIKDEIIVDFGGEAVDFAGLQIDFSDCYPTEFDIFTDNKRYHHLNNSRYFTTEDKFNEITYLRIVPKRMINNYVRLRIYEITLGIVNTFTNNELITYNQRDYVSPISETIPSKDLTIVVDNKDLYYCPDDPESTLAYMEVGQSVEVSFGYDVFDDGNIEWLDPVPTYLKSWSADVDRATFVATDRFDYMGTTYKKGLYREEGISLYDLAVDVFEDAKIEKYFIDPYLKTLTVYNPIPFVTHAVALQLIANASKSILYEDTQKRIHIKSSFVPKMVASSPNETEYSKAENVLNGLKIIDYGEASLDYTLLDGSIYYAPNNIDDYGNVGFISNDVANSNGTFSSKPILIITSEALYSPYNMSILFANIHPAKMKMRFYQAGELAETIDFDIDSLLWVFEEQLPLFDKLEIEFTKGSAYGRVFIDSIVFDTTTDYALRKNTELTQSPLATRQKKVQALQIVKTEYKAVTEEDEGTIASGKVKIDKDNNILDVVFYSASYDLSAVVKNENISVEIIDSSNYFATLQFSGATEEIEIEYEIHGKIYDISDSVYEKKYNANGEIITWTNPLVSTNEHAEILEDWLAEYFLGDVDYDLQWRGDPRVEGNDLFNLETVVGMKVVRAYNSTLSFSNAGWKGTLKARKVYDDE